MGPIEAPSLCAPLISAVVESLSHIHHLPSTPHSLSPPSLSPPGPQVVPNTVPLAQQYASEARVITEAQPPYHVTFVSDSYLAFYGHEEKTLLGQSLKVLQGPATGASPSVVVVVVV